MLAYLFLRTLLFPLALLPYRAIHALGQALGTLVYHIHTPYRKRALANLALAKDLNLTNEEIRSIAKQSIQSLAITCLEYPRLAREKNIKNIVTCVNPEEAATFTGNGQGVIFFCGHQSNWELLFLEGTSRMPGTAIGRPIKNPHLYKWVMSIRQKFGGVIVPPKRALKEGLRTLKKGAFLGIVGDQGMPDSGFSSSFLGRRAWTSPAPALLAYKTGSPLFVATTKRLKGRYEITYSKPLIPNTEAPMEQEVHRLMTEALALFEQKVKECPSQWLWIHNRWKQQTLSSLRKKYRQDSIALFLPNRQELADQLPFFRKLYPTEDLTIFTPPTLSLPQDLDAEQIIYSKSEELLLEDYRFKLIFNFTGSHVIAKHYQKLATTQVCHLKTIDESLETLLKNA